MTIKQHRAAMRNFKAEEFYHAAKFQREETKFPYRPMSYGAQVIRNIVAAILLYAGLWWIALEVVK